jgi:hypothetical protein
MFEDNCQFIESNPANIHTKQQFDLELDKKYPNRKAEEDDIFNMYYVNNKLVAWFDCEVEYGFIK